MLASYLVDIDQFVIEHGEHPIRVDVAEEGKLKLGWGVLSEFEVEVCTLLNGELEIADTEPARMMMTSDRSRASA